MKKFYIRLLVLLLIVLALVSCKQQAKETDNKIVVASHTKPMTQIIELIKDDLKKEGYELTLMKVTDNVQANVAVKNKEADANFFQHELFMEMFNTKNKSKLVSVQPVYNAIVAFYGKNIKSIDDIKENATVAVPQDPTNMTRALRLLQANKLIELKDKDSYNVKIEDIKNNPKNLKITGISLLNLNEAYNEKDLIFNYPTYISQIGLNPKDNGVMVEKLDNKFAITLVAREDNKDTKKIKALIKHIKSDKVKDFIEKNLKGHAEKAFK